MSTEQNVRRYAWIISNVISFILLICLSIIWHYVYTYPTNNDTKLRNEQEVMTYLQRVWLDKYTMRPPTFIPTGIHISNLLFNSANELNVVFYIWQKYPIQMDKEIQPNFYIVEAVSFKNKFNLFDKIFPDKHIIGHYIETKIRQHFDYHKYPFDDKTVYISIWTKYHFKNVILIPDFASYYPTKKNPIIGIDTDIRLRGFIIHDSYFGYKPSDYDTNFGQINSVDLLGYPYFYFAVVLKRALFTEFVFHVLPLLIAYILLFSILLMNTERRYKLPLLKPTGTMTLINCASIFFVLVIIHIGFRTKLYASQIIYLEYFYLLIYILMILVVINNYVLLGDTKRKIKFIHYADNLIPKILFWPLVFTFALLISIKILL